MPLSTTQYKEHNQLALAHSPIDKAIGTSHLAVNMRLSCVTGVGLHGEEALTRESIGCLTSPGGDVTRIPEGVHTRIEQGFSLLYDGIPIILFLIGLR